MWIRDVDVPPSLLEAARAGRLVIFVGAGASRDEPAGLPDFTSLVKDIGATVDHPPTDEDLSRPDVYLGRLADDYGIDVHRLVMNAIDRPESRPNRLHEAIVRLASLHPSPRIVTTNYDLHLTTAARRAGLTLPFFEAPALPLGDDFQGVVHLHGSLRQEPRRIVVTDKDFGRAYLLEAWAARFLERMFSAFTVLFIGYSHGDVVMQYLARSLGPSGKRFVCTTAGDDPAWRQYGLTPIPYAAVGSDHGALSTFLARWAELTAMGQVQHRALIRELVAAGPPAIPEEISYLREVLEHPERIRYFVECARGREWFSWVAEQPAFAAMFDREKAGMEPARTLMAWVADCCMLDESTSAIALQEMAGKPWPPETLRTVVHRLFAYDAEIPSWLSPWLLMTLQNGPGSRDDLLDMLLAADKWGANIGLAITLLEDRTRPIIQPAINFLDPAAVRFDINLPGDEYWLSEAWSQVFSPALEEHFEQIMASVDEQIARVYRALRNLGSDFDPFSLRRSAIEEHDQDSFRHPMDVLIDAARHCVEYALAHDVQLADRYINSWATRNDALFRRLALHAWRLRDDRTADEKLRWLQAQDWLWEMPLQHEVYLLLRDALPRASDEIVQAFVDSAKAGPTALPSDSDDNVTPYRSYNLLAWLASSAPDHPNVTQAFQDSQTAHPEFATREHPDLNMYMTSGFVEDALPYPPEEMHTRILKDPATAIAQLREFQSESLTFTGPTWTGALRSLQACVSANPTDGLAVANVLRPEDGELQNAIIRGWGTAEIDEQTSGDVLTTIEGWKLDEVRHAAAKMLSNDGPRPNATPWHHYPRARDAARSLWPTEPVTGAIAESEDLYLEAINHPAGNLAQFWSAVVQREWTQAGDKWHGIPGELKSELDRMIDSEDRNGLLATVILASELSFYFAADQGWASGRLLPLFTWEDCELRARGVWHGFLTAGHPNDGLLADGLLDAYLATCHHSEALPMALLDRLSIQLASMSLHAGADPLEWVPRFVVAASEELRVSWAEHVGRILEAFGPDEAGMQWERWICAYWSARVRSTPLPLATSEATAMAGWLISLPTVRDQAVALLVQTPAGFPRRGGLLRRLQGLNLSEDATNWAATITHLLRSTTVSDWSLGHHLKEIVQQLRAGDPAPDLSDLIDQALRLGVTDAADW